MQNNNMQPLTKSSSQPRNPTELLNNTPAYKCGWLNKRGMFCTSNFLQKIEFGKSRKKYYQNRKLSQIFPRL